jgi:hypothetical protein
MTDEASGNLVDEVSSQTLVPYTTPEYQKIVPGLWDGTDSHNKYAVETVGSNPRFHVNYDNNFLDVAAGGSIAFFVGFRQLLGSGSQTMYLVNKGPSGAGYLLRTLSGGGIRWSVSDGSTTKTVDAEGQHTGGAPHGVLCKLDGSTPELGIYTALDTTESGSGIPTNSLANAFNFEYCRQVFGSNGQCFYLVVWTGSAAESVDASTFSSLWTAYDDPSGELDTITCGSLSTDLVAYESGTGLWVGDWPGDTAPIIYEADLTGDNDMGLACRPAFTNLLTYSDDFSTWTTTSVITDLDDDSPRGFKEASSFVAAGANCCTYATYTTTAATVYTQYFFLKRDQGTDVAGSLGFYNETGSTMVATQAFTATDEWQLISLTATSQAGQVSSSFRITITSNGDKILCFRATAIQADALGPPIHSAGATTTMNKTDFRIASTAGEYVEGATGEIEITACGRNDDDTTTRYWLDAVPASGDNNRRLLKVQTDETFRATLYNNAGAGTDIDTSAETQSDEHSMRLSWSVNSFSRLYTDGSQTSGTALTSSDDDVTTIHVGQDKSAANQLNGAVALITTYDAEQ